MTHFKPMLAGKFDEAKLRFPVYVQPKLDGIRASVVEGRLVSRTLKPIPNRYIRDCLERREFEGLDGELIVGSPTADDCYRQTCSGVMSEDGQPDFRFFVFDRWNSVQGFKDRYLGFSQGGPLPHCEVVEVALARDAEALAELEATWVAQGFEGVILRSPDGEYKFGRGTASKQDLVKLKRFRDSEAKIVGVVEEQHNGNIAVTNALGRTERSTAKAGKTGKGTLGKFIVQKLDTGVEFGVGTGFDAHERAEFWAMYQSDPNLILGKIVKYKFFPVGEKDRPRHPVFLGFRDPIDIGDPS